MKIFGIGTDIVKTSRIKNLLKMKNILRDYSMKMKYLNVEN